MSKLAVLILEIRCDIILSNIGNGRYKMDFIVLGEHN